MATTTPLKEKTFPEDLERKIPKSFIMRRLHSALGLWMVLYLFQHLLINSQAALYFHNEAAGFIRLVNNLENLPYLPAIEVIFLALPFLIHGIWGVYYVWTGKLNAHETAGERPALPQYKRNRAYSWQRITSWILIPAILLHVIHMRFLNAPVAFEKATETHYSVNVKDDAGLKGVVGTFGGEMGEIREGGKTTVYVPNAGSAFFLMVREAFKNPLLVILYSIFVLAACYHAFNGLWTFMIRWGITLTRRSQMRMRTLANILMGVTMFLGLIAIWGVYWTTQFQI